MKGIFLNRYWILVASLLFFQPTQAQENGEELYNTFCAACHALEGPRVGPQLKGVRKNWEDAGELDLIYEWVKNPTGLKDSGKSKRATVAFEYSASNMNPQPVTNEQIDAILDFADSYVEPVAPPPPPGEALSVVPGENYKENQTLFYWLIGTIVLLLIAILVVAGSIKNFLQTPYYKSRISENFKNSSSEAMSNKIPMILLLLASYFTSFSAFGQTEAVEEELMFKISTNELYMLGVVVIVLFFMLIYQVRLFRSLYAMTRKPEELAQEQESLVSSKKINKILTDAVDIEEEGSILMDHEYDGIQELDNNLPPWWVWMFYATIIFAFVYLLDYHVFKISPLQLDEYKADIELAESMKDPNAVTENTATLLVEEADLSAGKTVFGKFCVACHKEDGRGEIGPNLTDDYWIHGNDIKVLFGIVKYGSPNGKMSPHEKLLTPLQIQQVTSYVLSMPYAEGLPPDGNFYGEEGAKDDKKPEESVVQDTTQIVMNQK